MKAQDLLAEGVLNTRVLASRYLVGFDESHRTKQAPGLPNHVVWNLGHLALTMHRAADRLDGLEGSGPVPAADFIEGGTKSGGGDATRFASESVAFGSVPVDAPAEYPSLARAIEIFGNACERLARSCRALSDEALQLQAPWGMNQTMPRFQLAMRMAFHNGFHVGQIADLRRAFGFKSIF